MEETDNIHSLSEVLQYPPQRYCFYSLAAAHFLSTINPSEYVYFGLGGDISKVSEGMRSTVLSTSSHLRLWNHRLTRTVPFWGAAITIVLAVADVYSSANGGHPVESQSRFYDTNSSGLVGVNARSRRDEDQLNVLEKQYMSAASPEEWKDAIRERDELIKQGRLAPKPLTRNSNQDFRSMNSTPEGEDQRVPINKDKADLLIRAAAEMSPGHTFATASGSKAGPVFKPGMSVADMRRAQNEYYQHELREMERQENETGEKLIPDETRAALEKSGYIKDGKVFTPPEAASLNKYSEMQEYDNASKYTGPFINITEKRAKQIFAFKDAVSFGGERVAYHLIASVIAPSLILPFTYRFSKKLVLRRYSSNKFLVKNLGILNILVALPLCSLFVDPPTASITRWFFFL